MAKINPPTISCYDRYDTLRYRYVAVIAADLRLFSPGEAEAKTLAYNLYRNGKIWAINNKVSCRFPTDDTHTAFQYLFQYLSKYEIEFENAEDRTAFVLMMSQ